MRLFRLFDCRSTDRQPAVDRVTLTWRDRHGEGYAIGTCRDISQAGMGIECLDPVPLKAPLSVRVGDDRKVAAATICYRAKQGDGYVLGLKFTNRLVGGEAWKRDELDMATDGMTW